MGNQVLDGEGAAENQVRRLPLQIDGSAVASEEGPFTHTDTGAGNLDPLGLGSLCK